MRLESCPNCNYISFGRRTYCPVCGMQLTYPLWKKIGAWVLLILIAYGWVRCNLKFMGGLGKPTEGKPVVETFRFTA
ncbi:MAG: hypothetical protein ACE15E_15825 [Acidobacteriota bacterium]